MSYEVDATCPGSDDGQHTWVRRRDGKECLDCGGRKFGTSTLTENEILRLVDKAGSKVVHDSSR
jgi:transcriptional regulator NrdR family protein